MIPRECKRLAEVDFPIAVVGRHSAREKSIRRGHPSTLHLWWARRPLAACRAMLMALLLPDPADAHCPADFRSGAAKALLELPSAPQRWRKEVKTGEGLRAALLQFIGDFSNWDVSTDAAHLKTARALVKAAHGDETPLVVDPFAGGGSIPLEALRIGCDASASDLNPVACLISKVMVEDIPRHGSKLAQGLREVGKDVRVEAEKQLKEFYPDGPDGSTPIAYLWARTVRCESVGCGAEIPLVRSFWLCKKASRRRALRWRIVKMKGHAPVVDFEIFTPKSERDVQAGTVARARATCLACGVVLPPDAVRAQLRSQHGGGDVQFDKRGRRVGGARLLSVVTLSGQGEGRDYRLASDKDYAVVWNAQARLATTQPDLPTETLPFMSGTFNVPLYGMNRWEDVFTARQKVFLSTLASLCASKNLAGGLAEHLALVCSRMANASTALCRWHNSGEKLEGLFSRQAIGMVWDFAEGNPLSDATGGLAGALDWVLGVLTCLSPAIVNCGQVVQADARSSPLPDESVSAWFTDPPYYFAVPYADLSDFFFVWLKRCLPKNNLLRDPFDSDNPLTPKDAELCEMAHWDQQRYANKDKQYFENGMAAAFREGRRVLAPNGIGSVVFAHKTTEGWEALLAGLIAGGWTITASWPISTEMATRLRARESAALGTSVHLVCRPRPANAAIGDWSDVYRELPDRIGDWMERLSQEGVHGADLVFACIGPAMEVYSRYCRVEDAEGRDIPLGGNPEAIRPHQRGFLAYVWELVGRAALNQVLGTGRARPGEGVASALEEDARLTALFLWTLQSTDTEQDVEYSEDGGQEEDDGDDDDSSKQGAKKKGLSLVFDVVRRFAQPMGIHLPEWEGRIIGIEKGVVRLLPIQERAEQLFGEDGAAAVAGRIESGARRDPQMTFDFIFDAPEQAPRVRGRGERGRGKAASVRDEDLTARRSATTLDRVHAAMLLQAAGRASALRSFVHSEMDRGPEFLRLANALSALYPKDVEEKRLLDAMLLALPR